MVNRYFIFFLLSLSSLQFVSGFAQVNTDSLLQEAQKLYINHQLLDSEKILRELISRNNVDEDFLLQIHSQLGLVLESGGRLSEAKQTYLNALEYITEHTKNHYPIFYNRLAIIYLRNNGYDSALHYSQRSIKYSRENQQTEFLADALVSCGVIYYSQGQYQRALDLYKESLDIYEELTLEGKKASTLLNIGILYKELSLFDRSISYLQQAIEAFSRLDRKASLSSCYNAIANIYNNTNESEEALNYHFKALEIRQSLDDSVRIASSLNNIGNVYKDMDSLSTALDYHTKALTIKERLGDPARIASSLNNLGEIYFKLGNHEKAEDHYLRSLDLAMEIGDRPTEAILYNDLSKLYLQKKNYSQAKGYLKKGEALGLEMGTLEILRDNYELTSQLYEQMGRTSDALEYHKLHTTYKDSILNAEKQRALTEMQVRYETEQKERDIASLNEINEVQRDLLGQQKISIYTLVGSTVLLFLLSGLAYNRYRIKKRANAKITFLMRELHHRVKNNLNILSSLLSLQSEKMKSTKAREAIKEGELRVQAMTLLHQDLYFQDENQDLDFRQYVKRLIENIEDSYGQHQVTTDYNCVPEDLKLNVDKAIPLGLVINELISNAFKYAFKDVKDPKLSVDIRKNANTVDLSIRDNGKGFPEAVTDETKSFGMKMVQILIKQLKGTLTRTNEGGAAFFITLPL